MNTAYAEARRYLTEHNFGKAMAACQTYLAKYPNNAIFQALKYDIEEQQRQELSAFVASVDRQVEAEPDLDKRVNILREALDLHPGESHFERRVAPGAGQARSGQLHRRPRPPSRRAGVISAMP